MPSIVPLDRALASALGPSEALTMADTADITASTHTRGTKKPITNNTMVRTLSSGRIFFTIKQNPAKVHSLSLETECTQYLEWKFATA